jgi:hypothetical protein
MTKKNDLWAQLVIDPKKLKNLKWDFSQIIWEPWCLVVIDSDFNLSYLPPIARGGKVIW